MRIKRRFVAVVDAGRPAADVRAVTSLPRLAVFASGGGSNLRALHDASEAGDLHATIDVVVSNNSQSGALEFARSRGLTWRHISTKTSHDPGAEVLRTLHDHDIDLVVLAGYLKQLDRRVVSAYRNRAVNIHPAPLPRFGGPGMYGRRVHAAVLAAGVRWSGPTVHRVTENYDEGQTLAHRQVPVLPDDSPESLASRVLASEHDLYWRVIEELLHGAETPTT